MFEPDRARVAEYIVLETLKELDAHFPGMAERVEARINSAAKSAASDAALSDLQEAGRVLGEITS